MAKVEYTRTLNALDTLLTQAEISLTSLPNQPINTQLSDALKHYFGYDSFRTGQVDIIEQIIAADLIWFVQIIKQEVTVL